MPLHLVNEHLKFPKVSLIAPTPAGYLLLAAEVDTSPLPFFLGASARKKKVVATCKKYCEQLAQQAGVRSAVVFTARLLPPGRGRYLAERQRPLHVARFDVVVLLETTSLVVADGVKTSAIYQQLEQALRQVAVYTCFLTATNVKHIGPVDHQRPGVFLFNYFAAENTAQNLAVWEYTAGWFTQETGLHNSTVLLPTQSTARDYSIINHCRWDRIRDILPALLFNKSFRSYVLANFYANQVAAMPILYKMA